MGDRQMTVTNVELQSQITGLDKKVDQRHGDNSRALEDIGKKMDMLIELNLGQKLQAQLIGQIGEKLKEHDESFKEFYRRLGEVESTTKTQGWTWKLVGVVLLASIGSIGWMLAQMKEFYQYESKVGQLEDKIGTLEFLVQGRTLPVLPPAQTTSGPK
jgi:hypothetical protein